MTGAAIRPTMKATRQARSLVRGLIRPPKIPLIPAMRPVNSMSKTAESPISTPPIAAETGVKLVMKTTRLLPCYGPVRFFPSVDAALDVAGVKARVLRSLHRHRRALAEGAIEQDPFAGRRGQFVQHAAGADVHRQIRIWCVQRARNDAVFVAFALLTQIDDRDVGTAA